MARYRYSLVILIFLSLAILGSACKNGKNKASNDKDKQKTDTVQINKGNTLVKFKDKVFSIPSPMLISKQIKEMNLSYDQSLTAPVDNYTKYHTSFKQAVALGIYGADLAYLLTYDQLSNINQYFNIIRKLSEELSLLNSITQETLDRIERNSDNKDSLMYITSTLFRDIDSYLSENEQQELGVIILAAGWIESVYMLTKLAIETEQEEIINRLGEQKAPLNNLLQLIEPYYGQGNADLDALFEKLAVVSSLFESIEQTYQYDMPEIYPEKHYIVIHSTTVTNLNNTDLEQISDKLYRLRTWLIN